MSAPPGTSVRPLPRPPHRYDFFQALRLLAGRDGGPQTIGGERVAGESVRVSPDPAGVFPASDVREALGERPVHVTVGFGGLYGVDAALPASFHESIRDRDESTRPLRDFLDFIGHRSYAQLWRAWARYRPEVRAWATGRADRHATQAAALAGVESPLPDSVPLAHVLPFAARFAAWARNAEGLQAVLAHATGLPVRVLENVPRFVRLTERPRVGRARLGVDALLGQQVYDEAGQFRVEIGPVGLDAFRDLLPGEAGAQRVSALIDHYTTDGLDYDVDLLLHAPDAPPLRLGDDHTARLGRTAHVGTPRTPHVRRRVRYAARPPSR